MENAKMFPKVLSMRQWHRETPFKPIRPLMLFACASVSIGIRLDY